MPFISLSSCFFFLEEKKKKVCSLEKARQSLVLICYVHISVLPCYQLLDVTLPGKLQRSSVYRRKVNTANRQLALGFAAIAQAADSAIIS